MKKVFMLFVLAFGLSFQGMACKCNFPSEFKVQELENYDYVALVKILELSPNEIKDSVRKREDFFIWATIEEITKFKGETPSKIRISGGKKKFGYGTSCDFPIHENEEWLVFANLKEGFLWILPCQRTTRYRTLDDKKEKDPNQIFKKLKRLNINPNQSLKNPEEG